ncbi:MAG: Uncharacterized protein LiPW31_295 [Microgenomates group bacterium LiPW_31]|nr:MAG: Uncharacterized protein LiPW31_295 [Microgenomates group bacterium LiPW_31]
MEVKEILKKIRQQEQEKKEYFFALELDEDLVKSAVWTVEEGVVKVLAIGETQSWGDEKEILEAVDTSLSSAAEKLPSPEGEAEPNKVIFGLASDWVEENKIVTSKLEILKKISKELEISPVGFVVIPEAIVHCLKTTEGIPPTAILAGLGRKRLTVTLVKLGKIVGIELVERSDNLGGDLTEGLSRFGEEEIFPARILLYNSSEDPEEEKQQLINYSWSQGRVNFLHLPKVEILPTDFDIRSIALAGGREVAKAEGIQVVPLEEEPVVEKEEKKEVPEMPEAEMMGFLKGKDITKEKPPEEKIPEPEIIEETPKIKEKPPARLDFSWLRQINFGLIKNFLTMIPRIEFAGKTPLIGGLLAVILFVFGGIFIACWWYLPKAEITLLVKPQILEKDFTIRLDPKLEIVDKSNLTLPAKEVKTALEEEKSRPTTGTKTVGDPAKGEVTIYNRTDRQKTFSVGTEIAGPNNLKFTFNDEVAVASESAGPDYTSIPGKAKVKVTAVAIGTEGNLASGTEFSIGNFSRSDFIAKNEEALGEGTSREVQVVAKEDQEKLLAELTEELKTRAIDELSKTTASDQKIIAESLTSGIIEKNFSFDVGQETSELKLNLKVEFVVLSFSEDELKNIIEDEVGKTVPAGFEYKHEESETSFSLEKVTKEGVAIFSVHLKANLVPKFDLEKMKKDLAGKYPDLAKQYFDNLPNIEGSEIKIRPSLPRRLATLPKLAKNIKIEIKVQ